MDKYIKVQDLIDRIYPVDPENDGSDGCTVVYQNLTLSSPEIEAILEELPAADVAPVRHGRWKNGGNGLYDTCSACEKEIYLAIPMNYCPECGALMGKED